MEIGKKIPYRLLERMEADLVENQGAEVLWVGDLADDGKLQDLRTAARGDAQSVPALFPHMERGDVVIHNHPSGDTRPSGADLSIASRLGNDGIGFWIVDGRLSKVHVVVEAHPRGKIKALDEDALLGLFEPGGRMEELFSGYERRPAQEKLLLSITRAFNHNQVLMAEAATGTGKSLAYLVPALKWAELNDERIVLATATINLQKQLLDKDLPLVQRILGTNLPIRLVLGRGNYLCLKRLEEGLKEGLLFEEEDGQLRQIAAWADESNTGLYSDVPFPLKSSLWQEINSDPDLCSGVRCAHAEKCFFLQARREAAGARILVANHHLVLSDLALRHRAGMSEGTAVLPRYHRLVFDEVHNLEAAASSFFSQSFSRLGILRTLGRLYRNRRGNIKGLLIRLEHTTSGGTLTKAPGLIDSIRASLDELDQKLAPWLEEQGNCAFGDFPPWVMDHYTENLRHLARDAGKLLDALKVIGENLGDEVEQENALELAGLTRRVGEMQNNFRDFLRWEEKSADQVFWVEVKKNLTYQKTPLRMGPLLKEAVFEPYPTVVGTSATLSVAGKFDYLFKRLGIKDEVIEGQDEVETKRVESLQLESPFDYQNRVLFAVSSRGLGPEHPRFSEYLQRSLKPLLNRVGGGALILFTSYRQLMEVYEALKPELEDRDIRVLRQGEMERSRLLDTFKEDVASVLLATDSFWEGVDSPGETLKLVVICRLPFRVPSDPVYQARVKDLERQGRRAFEELSLPMAVMKFKQGFGRLMRRKEDRGVVLVMDQRILTKYYGRIFVDSLPETRRIEGDMEGIGEQIAEFLG
jgi:ATP-dependent DNA helicase DinG